VVEMNVNAGLPCAGLPYDRCLRTPFRAGPTQRVQDGNKYCRLYYPSRRLLALPGLQQTSELSPRSAPKRTLARSQLRARTGGSPVEITILWVILVVHSHATPRLRRSCVVNARPRLGPAHTTERGRWRRPEKTGIDNSVFRRSSRPCQN
jgi:hypothetical protein